MSSKWTILLKLKGWASFYDATTAFDQETRTFYALVTAGDNMPFYLLGTNVDTGKAVSQGKGCAADLSNCPMSIHFFNK
jgi:hypothetical protein